MKAVLRLPPGLFEELVAHLLPDGSRCEEAAFLCVSSVRSDECTFFDVQHVEKLGRDDFDHQAGNFLELADHTRARLIKQAHDLSASLIEMHSHPGPWPAGFSVADRIGLSETVPHMWWRLKGRPYVALVVAPSGFDALVWLNNPKIPIALDAIVAGDRLLKPTNNSLEGWR